MNTIDIRKSRESDVAAIKAKFQQSAEFLSPWIFPPKDFNTFISESKNLLFVYEVNSDEIIGFFKISLIIRGFLQQAFLGFAAFLPYNNKGYMSRGLKKVLNYIFEELALHRIEVNVQPGNKNSKRLIKRNGFVKEGFSKNYLQVNGVWKDHERWAMTLERWKKVSRRWYV